VPQARWGEDAGFFGPRHAFRESLILRALRWVPPGVHLECAAGLGSLAQALAARGFRVVAADASWKSLVVARRMRGKVGHWVVADLRRLPFRTAAFASATCAETLEHVAEDRRALEELSRVLRPGGVLAGSVPHDPRQWSAWDDWAGHVRRYLRPELEEKLAAAGFAGNVRDWGFPLVRLYDALFLRRVNRRRLRLPGPAEADPLLGRLAKLARAGWLVRAVERVFALDRLFAGCGLGVGLVFFARKQQDTSSAPGQVCDTPARREVRP
jgi:SAM-dependent methyltransferase